MTHRTGPTTAWRPWRAQRGTRWGPSGAVADGDPLRKAWRGMCLLEMPSPKASARRDGNFMVMEYGQRWGFAADSGRLGAAVGEAMRAVEALSDTVECTVEGYQQALEPLHRYPDDEVTAVLRRGR